MIFNQVMLFCTIVADEDATADAGFDAWFSDVILLQLWPSFSASASICFSNSKSNWNLLRGTSGICGAN